MGKYSKDWDANKPKKPTRPMPAFAAFVTNYHHIEQEPKTIGKKLFRDAAQVWKNLDEHEQALFADHDRSEEYKESMAKYKETKSAMKKPPQSFGLFVKQYWKTKKPANNARTKQQRCKKFGRILKQIAVEWNKLTDEEQNVYQAEANLLKALFQQEQSHVLSGARELNLTWQNDGVKTALCPLSKGSQIEEQMDIDTKQKEPQTKNEDDDNEELVDDSDEEDDDRYD